MIPLLHGKLIMPRPQRYQIAGMPQHVIQRGNNRQATFRNRRDFAFYKTCLDQSSQDHRCQIHAYVLMTNHVHLLITPMANGAISNMMQCIGRRYVYYFNKLHERTGTLWEGRYKASLVQAEAYLLACYRYIELNPVRACMVNDPADYPHSSYRHNALGSRDPLITPHELYGELGSSAQERQDAYRDLFGVELEAECLASIRRSTEGCLVLGREHFQNQIELILSRSVRSGRPGRPRNSRADR